MGGFTKLLASREAKADGQRAGRPPKAGGGAPDGTAYTLDNLFLQADCEGIRVHSSMEFMDCHYKAPLIEWDKTVFRGHATCLDGPPTPLTGKIPQMVSKGGRKIAPRENPRKWLRVTGYYSSKGRWVEAPAGGYLPFEVDGCSIILPYEGPPLDDGPPSSDDGQEEEGRQGPALPAGGDFPDFDEGLGVPFEVTAELVAVREHPSLGPGAPPKGRELRGAVVRLFEWDATRKWRRVKGRRLSPNEGWMLLDHPEYGPLLRPVGLPFQVAPLDPLCMAALEGDLHHVQCFLQDGHDVNARDSGGRTPLMLAAWRGRFSCVVQLVRAGADTKAADCMGNTALQLANSGRMRALVSALSNRSFDEAQCFLAVDALPGPMRAVAKELLYNIVVGGRTGPGASGGAGGGGAEERHQEEAPEPEESSPCKGGTYTVAYRIVPVRREPSTGAEVLISKKRGEVVEALEFDPTGLWVKVAFEQFSRAGTVTRFGWMLVEHPELGDLLQAEPAGSAPAPACGGG